MKQSPYDLPSTLVPRQEIANPTPCVLFPSLGFLFTSCEASLPTGDPLHGLDTPLPLEEENPIIVVSPQGRKNFPCFSIYVINSSFRGLNNNSRNVDGAEQSWLGLNQVV